MQNFYRSKTPDSKRLKTETKYLKDIIEVEEKYNKALEEKKQSESERKLLTEIMRDLDDLRNKLEEMKNKITKSLQVNNIYEDRVKIEKDNFLNIICSAHWHEMEKYIKELFEKDQWKILAFPKKGADGGLDLVAEKTFWELDSEFYESKEKALKKAQEYNEEDSVTPYKILCAIQAKHWSEKVGSETIDKFTGAIDKYRINNKIKHNFILGLLFSKSGIRKCVEEFLLKRYTNNDYSDAIMPIVPEDMLGRLPWGSEHAGLYAIMKKDLDRILLWQRKGVKWEFINSLREYEFYQK